MIFSPLPGTPLITQGFGQNPSVYAQFGFAGHNGIDFGLAEGTPIYAPHDGVVKVRDEGTQNYGLSVTIEDTRRKSLLAHLSQTTVSDGQFVSQGDMIGKSGKTGMCTGPHLHWTFQIMKNGVVQNKDNGYGGAMDVTELTRLWLDQDLHKDAQYTDDAKLYLSMTFNEKQYLKRRVV